MTTDPSNSHSSVATVPPPAAPTQVHTRAGLSRWTAFGTGVGIEIRDKDLAVSLVRVRPSETGILGAAIITDFKTRPAAEWGTELLAFLRKIGVAHVAAAVLLPRRDVIVRAVNLPGVSDRDLESAIRLQIDSLHPFAEEDVTWSHARLGKSAFVLVGIARRIVIDQLSGLFAEAGIKVASFTFSAGAIWSALRLITVPPANFVCIHPMPGAIEVYGESEARTIYTAALPVSPERAAAIARAELRIDPLLPEISLSRMLPRPGLFPSDHDPSSERFEASVLPYATALAGACPWLGVESNLLPPELRRGSSRVRLIPTITLAVALVVLAVLMLTQNAWADSRYLALLQREIAKYEPQARRLDAVDKRIAATRARSQSLDDFRRRSKLDMDSLAEVTRLVPPPAWLNSLEMDRQIVQFGGETDQAAPLLERLDKSPLFEKSEFTMPITRATAGEFFRIRTQRTIPPVGQAALPAAGAAAAVPPPGAAPAPAANPGPGNPIATGGAKK